MLYDDDDETRLKSCLVVAQFINEFVINILYVMYFVVVVDLRLVI